MTPCRAAVVLVALLTARVVGAATESSPQFVAASAARSVVKIYGAGGLRGLEAYQSGIILSPDGLIATAMSTVLDSDGIDCVLDDGRRFEATLLGVDPRRELEPRTDPIPRLAITAARMSPSLLGLVSTVTPMREEWLPG